MNFDETPAPSPHHHRMLHQHWERMVALMGVAVTQTINPITMAFIVSDLRGAFGLECMAAGEEFLSLSEEGEPCMVIGLGCDDGLVPILWATFSDLAPRVQARAPGHTPVLLVVQDDPAVLLVPTTKLVVPRSS